MESSIKLLSSLIKVRSKENLSLPDFKLPALLKGERTTFQIGLYFEGNAFTKISASSDFLCEIEIDGVRNVPVDFPTYKDADDDYLIKEPGILPDLLVPSAPDEFSCHFNNSAGAYFVSVKIPEDTSAGNYNLSFRLNITYGNAEASEEKIISVPVRILDAVLPEESFLFTEWFHVDCIADYYRTGIYTEAHWDMIGKFMDAARNNGITMLLVPVLTPSLDTMIGTKRPCVQLVDIVKNGDSYSFDFTRMDRFVSLAKEKGFLAFEMSHLFSQWGAKSAPNIVVTENGQKTELFGWNVSSTSPVYFNFLKQYLPALVAHLKKLDIFDRSYFHLSDEPSPDAKDMYATLRSFVKPLLEGRPVMDALSTLSFAEEGLVDMPVTSTNHIAPFLEKNFDNQWAYYCCGQYFNVGNHFTAMPSYRNRILGIQLFKYDIRGFLQWGFNFYYSQLSARLINPYLTCSGDGVFPSGDAFVVYPGPEGPLNSVRGLVFADALQDIRILKLAADKVGKEKIVKLIDQYAGMNVTFDQYPRNYEYIPTLMDQVKSLL